MMSLMVESSITLVNSWTNLIESEGGVADVHVDEYMRSFSGDVISRACFGSNYSRGEEIFSKLNELQVLLSKKVFSSGIPVLRFDFYFILFFCPYIKHFLYHYVTFVCGCHNFQTSSNKEQKRNMEARKRDPLFDYEGSEGKKGGSITE